MIFGHVRDFMPRLSLSLPGRDGPVIVEFIVDTGFDGELSLPSAIINGLDVSYGTERTLRLADGSLRRQTSYKATLEWDAEERVAEIIALENDPLRLLVAGRDACQPRHDGWRRSSDPTALNLPL